MYHHGHDQGGSTGASLALPSRRDDGQQVYTFQVRDTWIFTSQDNERIQVDTATLAWTSDFRGMATGQGRCVWAQR